MGFPIPEEMVFILKQDPGYWQTNISMQGDPVQIASELRNKNSPDCDTIIGIRAMIQ